MTIGLSSGPDALVVSDAGSLPVVGYAR
ncbi:MAG: hypothetical protein QOE59_2471, partial [Actinomycetota bacterium]|nr:hypothetical protein [Actinomycetota bacterium]